MPVVLRERGYRFEFSASDGSEPRHVHVKQDKRHAKAWLEPSVSVTDDTITVDLEDGRSISVPTAWYPRLLHATPEERSRYEIDSVGVTRPDVEADFSIRGLLLGRKSGESSLCFKFWLDNRKKGRRGTVEQWLDLKRRQSQPRRTAARARPPIRKAK